MSFEVGHDILKNESKSLRASDYARGRLRFVYSVFTVALFVAAGYTFWLGAQGTGRTRLGTGAGQWTASRADITDRNGDILAKNIMSGHIQIHPKSIKDIDAAAQLIHAALPGEYSVADAISLIQKSSQGRYTVIKRFANPSALDTISKARMVGVEVLPRQDRRYPKRRLFSHTVGFAGFDGHGQEGAEKTFDKYLTENTDPLQLSLDSRIQSVFYDQLSIAMQKYRAKSAMGMLMNSRTGEMIAMVSLPDFDPENIVADPMSARMFMPMRGVFEIGSIFKIFNTAMAFENGIDKKYFVNAPFNIPDKFGRTAKAVSDINAFKKTSEKHPFMSVSEIMLYSCNVGSAQIALDLADGVQREFFGRINMDVPLDLEFGRTEKSLMPAKWGPVERAVLAYGHGMSVSPMHVMLAVNAMTNGGIYIYPTLRKRTLGAVKGVRVISDEISQKLRGIMFQIADVGSGKLAKIAGINIGGKTATAEKYTNGKPDRKRNLTSFVGVFPIEAPQYIMLVMLDEPAGTDESFGLRTAAWNVVPTTGKILDSILPLLFD